MKDTKEQQMEKDTGWGGHRACPRASQTELGCLPRDPQAGYTGCKSGAQSSGVLTL